MAIDSINSIVSSNQLPSLETNNKNSLGKDDFLKLMITQMKYQDPLSPMDNQQMLAQMAQFSSLEQMSNINTTLKDKQANESFLSATQMLGKNVYTASPDVAGQNILSKVASVSSTNNGPQFTLENGMTITVDQIIRVQ